jgi:hypothetical protein
MQFNKLSQLQDNEKENRVKTERLFNILSDRSNVDNLQIKNKITVIQDVIEKEEKWKIEQREKDLEMYKTIIGKLTEKVSETVKLEVEARFKADMDGRAYTQVIGQKALEEINSVRRDIDVISKEARESYKDNNRECADRAHNLSKYVDSLLQNSNAENTKQIEKVKNFLSKLTDQVKSSIINQDEQNVNFDGKIKFLETYTAETKDEIFKYVIASEERQTKRLKEFYDYIDNLVRINTQRVNERIDSFSDSVDSNFKIVVDQLVDTRSKLSNRIEVIEDTVKEQFKVLVLDIETTLERIYKLEALLAEYDKQNKDIKHKIEQDLSEMLSRIEIKHANDSVIRKLEYEELKKANDLLREDLVEFGQNVQNDMGELMKNFETNYLNLFERSKLTFEQMNRMAQSNIQMFEEFENNMQKMQDEANYQEVRNLWDTMLEKVENEEMRKHISERKEVEHYLHGTIHEMSEELKNFQTIMYQNNENLTQAVQKNRDFADKVLKGNEEGFKLILDAETDKLNERVDELESELLIAKAVEEEWHKMLNTVEQKIDGEKLGLINKRIDQLYGEIEDLHRQLKISEAEEKVNNKIAEELDRLSKELVQQKRISDEIQAKALMDNLINKIDLEDRTENILEKVVKSDATGNLILSKLAQFNEQITKVDKDITDSKNNFSNNLSDALDVKIGDALERMKRENYDMWVSAVELSQSVNTPEGKYKINFRNKKNT